MTWPGAGRGRPVVLILRALGLGDFLTGVPACRGVRAAFPGHWVVLAAPAGLAPLAPLTGAVDQVLPTRELAPIPWRGHPPAVVIDMHGSGPASHGLVRALGAPTAMMYASPADPAVHGPWWDSAEHEVARWCRLCAWWDIPADPSALALRQPGSVPAVPGSVPAVPGAVVVHPGAASGSRRWPPERFAAVAKALAADGHPVVVTGGRAETALARLVARRAGLPGPSVLAGRTSLLELAAQVAAASIVISNDTGVAHLATAYGTRSVTLFGPVSPALWGPPASQRHVALWHGSGTRPGNPHGASPDPRLLRVSVAETLDAARRLLSGSTQPRCRAPAAR